MKEFENQEYGEKMSWKGFASKLMQPDAPGLTKKSKNKIYRTSKAVSAAYQRFDSFFAITPE